MGEWTYAESLESARAMRIRDPDIVLNICTSCGNWSIYNEHPWCKDERLKPKKVSRKKVVDPNQMSMI